MERHYYTKNTDLEHHRQQWEFPLRGTTFRFISDAGVFSKNSIDFGSRVLIDAFGFPQIAGDLLDVGCGYGPIGIALANEDPSRTLHMIDVNDRALELTTENAQLNKVTNVAIYESAAYANVVKTDFAAILTNPPIRAGKQVVHEILEHAIDHLQVDGSLWVVIQKKQGAPSAFDKMTAVFGNCEIVVKEKGYWILRSEKS